MVNSCILMQCTSETPCGVSFSCRAKPRVLGRAFSEAVVIFYQKSRLVPTPSAKQMPIPAGMGINNTSLLKVIDQ
jgi:hypothetical protein